MAGQPIVRPTVVAVAVCLAATLHAAAPPRFARLGAFEGFVEVQLDPADSWRPATLNLPLPESSRIRTAAAAKVEIELDDSSALRMTGEGLAELSDYTRLSGGQRITVISLDHGLAYFTGDVTAGSSIHLLVPGAQVSVKQGSRLRLQAWDTASEIAIIEGAARFTIPSAEMDLRQGQCARVTVPESTHFSLFREIAPLESDLWSEALDKAEAQAPASRLDLDQAGKWIEAGEYGTVWRPAPQPGWAPYRWGRWIWFQSVGFTWVGSEPWGWTPYHEGRWLQHPDLGWVWVPSSQESDFAEFSPGAVFWARSGNLTLWGPLAPGEQWTGAGPPRQFAAFNATGGPFTSGVREILPSAPEDLPKDLLKAFLFTAALPSPALPVTRLNATRDALRSRVYSAVEVAPEVARPVTKVLPPPIESDAAVPVAAEVAPLPSPVIVPDTDVPTGPLPPLVPGIVVVTRRDNSSTSRASANSSSKPTTSAKSTNSSTTVYALPVPPTTLNGVGVAGPTPLYQHWFQEFKEGQITYQPDGAGTALRELRQGQIDFAAVDTPLTDSQNTRLGPLYFPAAVSAVVPIYNMTGMTDGLRLTPELLAGIYIGEIRYWNDVRITAVNPRAGLPPAPILLINRTDSSATNYAWTDYLSKVSPAWKAKVGTGSQVVWLAGGLSAEGNEGVAKLVHNTPFSLGYVDLAYAAKNNIHFAELRNRAGHFVQAEPSTLTAAAESVPDFRTSITDAPGADSYPIAYLNYLLLPSQMSDPRKRTVMTDFLTWMLSDGQKQVISYAFAPLPSQLVSLERKQLSKIR
jgi:phosphate transport system substrate-binding protein